MLSTNQDKFSSSYHSRNLLAAAEMLIPEFLSGCNLLALDNSSRDTMAKIGERKRAFR